MKKLLVFGALAMALAVSASAATLPSHMVLEPGLTPQDSTLHFKTISGTYATRWAIVAEGDTCRFYVYLQSLIGQTPNYIEYVLSPETGRSWDQDSRHVRADSIKAGRKSLLGKASVHMYP